MLRLAVATAAALSVLPVPGSAAAPPLPRVTVTTAGPVRDEPKVTGRLRIGGDRPLRTRIGIEVRGHSSQAFPKKQYAVETRTAAGRARDVSPLGLPPGDDWVLSAPYTDKSLVRNALAYRTAARLGRYAPRTRFVELVLDGDYRGVYVLTERPKLGDHRLPSQRGNFLLELTFPFQARGEDHFLAARTRRPILWLDPDRDDLTRREAGRIRAAVDGLEHSLYARGRRGPSPALGRRLDLGAAADFLLVQELFQNADAFHGSTYLHRAPDGRIALGPVWDFDLSMGNSATGPAARVGGFVSAGRPWGGQLLRDRGFRRRLAARWWQLRDGGLRTSVLRDLAGMRRRLAGGPARRNFDRWRILGRYVWPNPRDRRTGGHRTTWASEVAFVRSRLQQRTAWLDRALPRPGGSAP